MTNIVWLLIVVVVAALMFAFGVWWTKRHPNESQRYFTDFEQARTNIEQTVKQQTDRLSTVVDSIDTRLTTVEKSAQSVNLVAVELKSIVDEIKSGLVRLGAKADQIPETQQAIVTDPLAKK